MSVYYILTCFSYQFPPSWKTWCSYSYSLMGYPIITFRSWYFSSFKTGLHNCQSLVVFYYRSSIIFGKSNSANLSVVFIRLWIAARTDSIFHVASMFTATHSLDHNFVMAGCVQILLQSIGISVWQGPHHPYLCDGQLFVFSILSIVTKKSILSSEVRGAMRHNVGSQ